MLVENLDAQVMDTRIKLVLGFTLGLLVLTAIVFHFSKREVSSSLTLLACIVGIGIVVLLRWALGVSILLALPSGALVGFISYSRAKRRVEIAREVAASRRRRQNGDE